MEVLLRATEHAFAVIALPTRHFDFGWDQAVRWEFRILEDEAFSDRPEKEIENLSSLPFGDLSVHALKNPLLRPDSAMDLFVSLDSLGPSAPGGCVFRRFVELTVFRQPTARSGHRLVNPLRIHACRLVDIMSLVDQRFRPRSTRRGYGAPRRTDIRMIE